MSDILQKTMEEAIVSISTPLGRGAVAIVRMSGSGVLDVAHSIFSFDGEVEPRYMHFGKLKLLSGEKEECLMVFFKEPFSYTGEDVVEFQIHGGVLIAQKVVETCVAHGARLAEPGEFSKRAFLNGKITLDKAEAIIGEINAETEGELRSSLQVTNGKLSSRISEQQEKIKTLLAEIEVGMDYPDETEEDLLIEKIKSEISKIAEENKKIIDQSQSARYLKNGINVALVGKTNVGKSSVMNALLGEDRAIVTAIQGTTRDSITESFLYDGIKINLVDTAGIRQTDDVVESIGIEKSKQTLENADLVLFVLDGSEKQSLEDLEIEKMLIGKKVVFVINKSDMPRKLENKPNEIVVSALKNENIENLKDKIVKMVIENEIDFNSLVLTNERQIGILESSHEEMNEIVKNDLPLDILAMKVKNVWKTLGKITGNTENEDIIDLIFSKFCLGK